MLDQYKAAGFNCYTAVLSKTETGVNRDEAWLEETLEMCQDAGLTMKIRLHGNLLEFDYNVFEEEFPNIHDKFLDYPALSGFYIADEPSWTQLLIIEAVYVPWFNEHYADSRLEFFCNLLSGYSTLIGELRDIDGNIVGNGGIYDGVNGVKLTEQQKADFLQAYHNKWLGILATVKSANKQFSHDRYPFFDNQAGWLQGATDALPNGYQYYMLETWLSQSLNVANQARDKGYDYSACIQVFDQGGATFPNSFYRLPTTVEEIKWQVYMNLAMGAKTLIYFGYDQSTGGSYMTLGGDPLPMYYLVQETNEELNKVDHVFAAFKTWLGIKTFVPDGDTPSTAFQKTVSMELEKLTGVSDVETDRDLVVGEMVDEKGNHGYLLVGYDDPLNKNETKVEMTFDGAAGFIVYRGGVRTLVEAQEGGVFSATLAAGEGVFIIPVYMD